MKLIKRLISYTLIGLSFQAVAKETMTVTDHAGNQVEIMKHPKRIASLHVMSATSILLDLQAPIVGTSTYIKLPENQPYIRGGEEVFGIKFADTGYVNYGHKGSDIEQIKASKPDLIIGTVKYQSKVFDKLSAIAPTVLIKRYTSNIFDAYRDVATWVGEEAIFEERYAQYQQKINDFKNKYSEELSGKTFVYAVPRKGKAEIKIRQNSGIITQVLFDLGLSRTQFLKDNFKRDDAGDEVSSELIQSLDADWFFSTYSSESGAKVESIDIAFDDVAPGWQSALNAYKTNQFIRLNREKAYAPTFVSVDYVLNALEQRIIENRAKNF
ncbi:ABC transporter substrate-binding protein [Aliivibrio kagoshimensis]|uniref:ABC transporter substrate-binding protein n=1 Tax=Aliivibrio kagoshimensis TaxID=2910230 RepID=UPI003D0D1043